MRLSVVLIACLMAVSACNTVEGVGQDISAAARALGG